MLELRFEGEERRALRTTFKSKGWAMIVEEVRQLREVNRNYMMEEFDRDEMMRRQGYDRAADVFLKLESLMLEEERLVEAAHVEDLSHLRARGG